VLRAAYAHTAAATGAFPAVSAATGSMAGLSGPLRRITGDLTRLTGALPQLPGAPDQQESGLATLFAITSAAVVSDGNTLNVATQIWRTGSFPQLPPEATGPQKAVPAAPAAHDMYADQGAPTVPAPVQQANYQRRQQAGIDALLSIATPVFSSEDTQEQAEDTQEQAEDTQEQAEDTQEQARR